MVMKIRAWITQASRLIVLICVTACVLGGAQAEPDPADPAQVKDLLIRDGEWVLERWETFMGSATDCSTGLSFDFAPENVLTVNECVDRKTVTTFADWFITDSGDGAVLTMDGIEYSIESLAQETIILIRYDESSAQIVEEMALAFLEP